MKFATEEKKQEYENKRIQIKKAANVLREKADNDFLNLPCVKQIQSIYNNYNEQKKKMQAQMEQEIEMVKEKYKSIINDLYTQVEIAEKDPKLKDAKDDFCCKMKKISKEETKEINNLKKLYNQN